MPTKDPKQAQMHHGPQNPFDPLDDPEVITHTPSGSCIVRQQYEDGYLYEYMASVGARLDYGLDEAAPVFAGQILHSYEEDGMCYLSVWVPNDEAHIYDKVFTEVSELPEVELSIPTGQQEELYNTSLTTVTQSRYSNGVMVNLNTAMGVPWPYLPDDLTARLVKAPMVSVTAPARRLYVKFWVADNLAIAPPVPAGVN